MKMCILLIIISLFFTCCCNKPDCKNELKINVPTQQTLKKKEEIIKSNQYIVNDSIIRSWIGNLTQISREDTRFDIEIELKSNRHWDYIDTIKTLTYKQSKMTVLSTTGFYGLWSAEIKNSEIPVWNYIKIGMKKYELEETLETKIISDTVEIGNLEQTTVFEFNFKDEKLKRIFVTGFVD